MSSDEQELSQLDKQSEQNKRAHKAAKTLGKVSVQVDHQARNRDARVNAAKRKKQEPPNLSAVDKEEQKANQTGHTIVKLRDKNKAEFTQLVNANFTYLYERNYLTRAEESLILRLMSLVELNSNAITMAKKTDNNEIRFIRGQVPKLTELAKLMSVRRQSLSTTINQLIRKGILYELVDTETLKRYGRPVNERPLFFNPEIVIAADKNHINLTLCRLHWANDRLEKEGLKLPWKIWYAPGLQYGRIYRRSTWLKKIKENND